MIQPVALDPAHERERVHTKYASMRRRDLVGWGIGLVVILAVSRFVTVDWYFYIGMIASLVAWEITKFRLRIKADRFAGMPRSPGGDAVVRAQHPHMPQTVKSDHAESEHR